MNSYNITLAMIKPDAIKKKIYGYIIQDIINNGFKIIQLKMYKFNKKTAYLFYEEHIRKSFFKELIKFICEDVVIILILYKHNAINDLRKLIGNTNPNKANKNTIRFKYGTNIRKNSIHSSKDKKSFLKEFKLFFNINELCI